MAWKPPSLFFAATVRKSSIIRGKCPGSAKSTATGLRIHGAGNDENGITLDPGSLDSDKASHRAALS
ncbi:hypothetical protein PUP66_18325 [Pseudomonas chlororaphis]|uniref:hypothetical protein n=1 Tax=Pseudomonas chlororaphis TaxID=587753 RepID=UPI000F5564C3|nr:hypothetical protein [Pseudomonas chlororaphis]AZD16430.1 hypothetical protein C4K25_3503 [Pseudomonas chlororaphis]WDH45072.1 hypothetical protein PUP66_18325 [Pseudomonas chlororaphis]WDH56918.1 hypothetical protein PUP56_18330 [Pseudomonas chlororaphis]WQE16177.1 hypothetical protein U0007_17140 [Pseudomonas chlororaphis]